MTDLQGLAKFSKTKYILGEQNRRDYYLTMCQCGWGLETSYDDSLFRVSQNPQLLEHRIDHLEAKLSQVCDLLEIGI